MGVVQTIEFSIRKLHSASATLEIGSNKNIAITNLMVAPIGA